MRIGGRIDGRVGEQVGLRAGRRVGLTTALGLLCLLGCSASACSTEPETCGPTRAEVSAVIDGDTIDLDTGQRVRYLMIDTPESTVETECGGPEAKQANAALVAGQTVTLRYDLECEDRYGRLLAYVEVGGREVNKILLERGHACVLHISPNGDDVVEAYEALEYEARQLDKGLWSHCDPSPCG